MRPDLNAKKTECGRRRVHVRTGGRRSSDGREPALLVARREPLRVWRLPVHATLAVSLVGDSFRNRLRMFLSLVVYGTIAWFCIGPEEALLSVAILQVQNSDVVLPNLESSLA